VYFVLRHFGLLHNLYYLPICQAHIFVRCLLAKNSVRAFFIAQKAFWEGIAAYRSTRNTRDVVAASHPQADNSPARRSAGNGSWE
jgi:hypothetical protein